ncbi:hypothetical protein CIB93_33990 [Streptomyces sp. WZ.A104]|nr:hypothetical protein CIB93_33990 [Streptomyces sp. WZ.A104]
MPSVYAEWESRMRRMARDRGQIARNCRSSSRQSSCAQLALGEHLMSVLGGLTYIAVQIRLVEARGLPGGDRASAPLGPGLGTRVPGFGTARLTLPGVRGQCPGPKLGSRDSGVGTRDPGFERLL